MFMMYCPSCEKNVVTKQGDFSLLLAFLLSFTGLGLVIYILYYLDKKKDLCIHCETKCQTKKLNENQTESKIQLQNDTPYSLEYKPIELEKIKINFCHNCGVELGERENINYCALCGSDVN